MKRKILVAGGGHGGIGAAYVLAKNGLDVTVIEKNSRAAMGHDWTDIFDKKGFTAIGMEIPPRETYTLKENMTFIGPGRTIRLRQNTDPEKLEIQMERKELYRYLIENAESAGVKFIFECEVFAPVMLGSRVVGIETAQGTMYADLVIDACGIQSPLRTSLPEYLGIQNEVRPFEQFFVYRAFYNKAAETEADRFAVELLRDGKLGISWVAAEEEYTDVLIGRLEPIDQEEAERTLAGLRRDYPSIGETKLRGGQFVRIPVRQPLGVLVADGYAAIGDSAFMTVPIIGSGIANSLKAARCLADCVLADTNGAFNAASLWKYQTDFYALLGAGLAPLACIKLLLTRLEPAELDYIFETGILNAQDMTIDADSTSIAAMFSGITFDDLKIKAGGLFKNADVFKKIMRVGREIAAAMAVCAAMPKTYDADKVLRWVKNYNACFKR